MFKKLLLIFLYGIAFSSQVHADDNEYDMRSPAKRAYDKAVAEQKAKKEIERHKAAEERERWKQLEAEQAEEAKQYEIAEMARQKECGKDYGEIRVGMKLSRVQKCVGEFFLHGQVKNKYGLVSYYTRGDTFLFVKNGKVVAWGE